MSKNYLGYGRNEIICDYCQVSLGVDEPNDNDALSITYQGMNNGQHECTSCKKSRHYAYDNYVDPLHVYH